MWSIDGSQWIPVDIRGEWKEDGRNSRRAVRIVALLMEGRGEPSVGLAYFMKYVGHEARPSDQGALTIVDLGDVVMEEPVSRGL